MNSALDDLDTIKDVNDAWTRYLKPIIDDIKAQVEQNPSTATASDKNIQILHKCQKLDLTKEVVELALRIILYYCNMEINLPLRSLKDEQFLQGLTQNWEKFKIFVKIVCSLFQYLDDNYFNAAQPTGNDKSLQLLSLQQRAFNIFKEQVFNNKIKLIQSLILDNIDQERSGETINIILMKNSVDMLIDLDPTLQQFYNILEIEFLQRARAFYQQFAQSSLQQDSIPDFMIKCETAYSVESMRIDNYMNKRTEPKIREVLDEELLKKNVDLLINSKESGFRLLLEHDRFEDLGRMYRLITHLDDEVQLYNFNMFDCQIEFHLAVYVDALMKTVEAQSLNKQIETRLDEIVAVLQYCHNKDIFLYELVGFLFERINEQGNKVLTNEVVEKAFIAKLKQAFGETYTQKLDRILQDRDLQIEMQTQFKEFSQDKGLIPEIDLQAQVLQKYRYSGLKSKSLNIPENIQQALQSFEQFYKDYQPERQIKWLPQLGSVEVQVQFSSKLCNITMQPTQAVVLLQFADGAQKSVKDLGQILKMKKEEVQLNVESLMQNIPILIRAAEGIEQEEQQQDDDEEQEENSELGDDEQLKLNKELRFGVAKFRLHKPGQISHPQFAIRISREEQMDMCIVTIMKNLKRMNYKDLINLVIDRITLFRPSSYDVKERVEVL
ncbi:MAG: hypothetical protein EZS28_006166, partial [Streblomastix strix]